MTLWVTRNTVCDTGDSSIIAYRVLLQGAQVRLRLPNQDEERADLMTVSSCSSRFESEIRKINLMKRLRGLLQSP